MHITARRVHKKIEKRDEHVTSHRLAVPLKSACILLCIVWDHPTLCIESPEL